MADQLYQCYLEAKKLGGLPASIRLASLARMSSIDAQTVPDDPATVKSLKAHLETVRKEYQGGTSGTKNELVEKSVGNETEKLRKYIELFTDVIASRRLYTDNIEHVAKYITSAITQAVDVERASIWLYDSTHSSIECVTLFEKSKNQYSKGIVLKKSDFPKYFETISNSRTLSAEDAHTHSGTAEFSESYLKPLGINSMLDVPIFSNDKMVGVVCHEHVGRKRKWTRDEENFAYLMGNIVGLVMERKNK